MVQESGRVWVKHFLPKVVETLFQEAETAYSSAHGPGSQIQNGI